MITIKFLKCYQHWKNLDLGKKIIGEYKKCTKLPNKIISLLQQNVSIELEMTV